MNIQAFFDEIMANARLERSRYHLTLGELAEIDAPDDYRVVCSDNGDGIADMQSYRGYYHDLALEPALSMDYRWHVQTLREKCRDAIGETFTGYKGGDYMMGKDTPLWVSSYSLAEGRAVVGYTVDHDARRVVLTIKAVD